MRNQNQYFLSLLQNKTYDLSSYIFEFNLCFYDFYGEDMETCDIEYLRLFDKYKHSFIIDCNTSYTYQENSELLILFERVINELLINRSINYLNDSLSRLYFKK